MSKIFTRTFRVRWSELDAGGTVAPAGYLRYLVETAYDWGDALGLGAEKDSHLGLFWLIRETEIRFLRPLRHNDVFDFTIWMVNWQRVRGTRCFELKLKDSGEIVAQGSQHIVAMSLETQRPASPPEDIIDNFRLEEPRVFPFERFPKVAPLETAAITRREVEWADLDALEHVNNAMYVTYAEEAAARDFSTRGWPPVKLAEAGLTVAVRRLQIQYLSPAVWGEVLTMATHPLAERTRYVGMARADGSLVCECLLDWELVDRQTGEVRSWPDEMQKQVL
jgi:acyl-CoA thioester hydrolase